MSATLSFKERLLAVIVPTRVQVLAAFFLALAIMMVGQSQVILERIGVGSGALHSISEQFHSHFDGILRSEVASQLAVITFWAAVGLVAYLICWGAYNVLVEARNEVTLNTVYTNRGHWRSPYHTLGLKAVAALGLGVALVAAWFGMALWLAMFGAFVMNPDMISGLLAVIAVLAAAVQLYSLLAFTQLTFTPWYRAEAAEAFTEG